MSYRYNPFGRRTHKTVDGEETHYLLDGDHVIAEYNDAGKLAKRYVYGAGIDQPILWSSFYWVGDYSYRSDEYYHRDALGSVIATSGSETGRLAWTHTYSPYGLPDEFGVVAGGNPYLYTGREYDSETGLYYYRNRYYDPQRGRFLQPDPIGYQAGMNLYAYVDGNPITWADPLGLDKMFQGASQGGYGTMPAEFEEYMGPATTMGEAIRDHPLRNGTFNGIENVGATRVFSKLRDPYFGPTGHDRIVVNPGSQILKDFDHLNVVAMGYGAKADASVGETGRIAPEGMFRNSAEASRALHRSIPVVWVGPAGNIVLLGMDPSGRASSRYCVPLSGGEGC